MTLEEDEQQALELEDRLAAMTDEEVVAEYQKTSGEPGDPWVDRLVNEMQEREVDFKNPGFLRCPELTVL